MTPYYQDTTVTIYHGDCREVMPELPRVDLVLTDPPYAHAHMDGGGLASACKFYREGAINHMSDFHLADYATLLLNAAPMLIAFHSRDLIIDYASLARDNARKYDLHVWYKANAIPFTANTWKSDLEYIALIWSHKPGWEQCNQAMHSKAYIGKINIDDAHPTAKPMALLRKYLTVLAARTVLDPFAGSGTTLRAAKDLGRETIGVEIDERHCEIAARRCAQEVLNFAEAST